MMSLKSSSRDRQVDAVYAAAPQMLEMVAARAKVALRGSLLQSLAHNDSLRSATDARCGKRRRPVHPARQK